MRPRVLGIDARRELAERLVQGRVARAIGVTHPGEVVAHVAPVGEHPGVLARELGKRRDDRQSEFFDKLYIGVLERTDHFATELHYSPVGEGRLLNPSARTVARLEDDHVRAVIHQIARGAQARQPGARDNHVASHGGILS